jgi:hypothetical protein
MVKLRVGLDDTLLRWARIQAAQEGTTAPKLIAGILQSEKARQERIERARKRRVARSK